MHPIQFVYFDLGNVLVRFDHEIAVKNLVDLTGIVADQVRQALFGSGLEDRYELGEMTNEVFVHELSAAIGQRLEVRETLEAVSNIFEPNESVVEALEYVQSAGIPMGLISNTCDAHWKWVKKNRYRTVEGWFGHSVLSFQVHSMKPARFIYEYAANLATVSPNAIFFTDDKIDNVLAARAVGWQAEQFTSAAELLDQLRDRIRL